MGANPSKPSESDTQHVFTSETPVHFSQNLVNSLQSSPESDSTRAKDLELHVQTRVAAELKRLDAEASKSLKDLEESISTAPDSTTDSTNTAAQPHLPDQSASAGGVDHKAKADGDRLRDLSRASVQREIESLKGKLQQRRVKEEVTSDEGVNKARDEVVRCLRVNDRRPLDCWKEVETFRREVGRLEGAFLGRVLE